MATPTLDQLAAEDNAFLKQSADARNAKAQQEALQNGQEQPSLLQKWTAPIGRVTSSMIDSAVSAADSIYETPAIRKARDVASGAITGATNIADTVMSHAASGMASAGDQGGSLAEEQSLEGQGITGEDLAKAGSPIWDHAKNSILDFRDAVAVQDPTLADSLTQGVAQLAVPFAGYSRMLGGLHFLAQTAGAGALTDATALGPHDARMADLIALGRHTEGKLGDALRTLAPDGSAVNAYIEYLADRSNESEAEGRFKNVLDGFGVNLIATPLIHAAANVLKQGTAGLRYLIENGAGSGRDIVATPRAQRGAVGDLSRAHPPLRQGVDPAQPLLDEQVRRDADAARTATKRPPLRQGGSDPAESLYDEQVRRDVEAAHVGVGTKRSFLGFETPEQGQYWSQFNPSTPGIHVVESPNGFTHAVENANGDYRVISTETRPSARGTGEGLARMEQFAEEAHAKGKQLVSDVSVSPEQQNVYAALKRRGYDVQRNPGATVNEITGNLISDDPRRPVFTVGPKKGKK